MDKKTVLNDTLKEILNYIGAKNEFSIDEIEADVLKAVIHGENLNYLIGLEANL